MTARSKQLLGAALAGAINEWLSHVAHLRDAESLRRALTTAYDADTVIDDYVGGLTDRARARAADLNLSVGDDDLLGFAVDVLAPFRRRNARRFLDRSAVDADALRAFLDYVREHNAQGCAAATDGASLAEATITALDELHTYLLAHDLVSKGYMDTEIAVFGEPDGEPDSQEGTVSGPSDDSAVSNDADLALAA